MGHDPDCYLCPGNKRADGSSNPDYSGPWSFPNDFPALLPAAGDPVDGTNHLFVSEAVAGEARVICFGPDHSRPLGVMTSSERRAVVDEWCRQSQDLGARWSHVQIFENRGAMMGASSPHPHGQVWASDFIPDQVKKEDGRQKAYLEEYGRSLLADLAVAEVEAQERVVVASDCWLVLVPFWAAWPFETLLLARQDVRRLEDLSERQRNDLAEVLGHLLQACDRLFDTPFPYSMGWHGAPHGLADSAAHWQLHAHIFPPLLRSAEVRKHMVGFELLAETQRDLTPEAAAARLRAVLG